MDFFPASGTAVIVLAAGGSSRLGSAKQLLVYRGQTLLRRAVEAALAAAAGGPVVVVLGANAERMRRELGGLEVTVVENSDWERGMGGSVRCGMAALGVGEVRGVLLTLCDQPLVGADELRRVVAVGEAQGEGRIAAAAYSGSVGVPAWFEREFFEELGGLPDEAGAKRLLQRQAERVTRVELPEAEVDVDTAEQYERLVSRGD